MSLQQTAQDSRAPSCPSEKRPGSSSRPALLPAFEPFSSSPLPRVSKRKSEHGHDNPERGLKYYPTPIPTSSTGILASSSPTRSSRPARPGLSRTISTLSERNPLCAVPSVSMPVNGEALLMGRSSNSSHYQLSASRLISRVHVRGLYLSPTATHTSGQIQLECLGWNGAKVHCRGQVYELGKGDTFTSDQPGAEIMLDVQDTRVTIVWPDVERFVSESVRSGATWQESGSPTPVSAMPGAVLPSSPPALHPRSPVSPSPIPQPDFNASSTFIADDAFLIGGQGDVQVYEDSDAAEEPPAIAAARQPVSSRALSEKSPGRPSQESALSSFQSDDFSDQDEENDPIITSFGPAGHNLLPRMASFTTGHAFGSSPPQPQHRRPPLKEASNSPQKRVSSEFVRRTNESPIKNHVINQLAFSRLHSIPLSTILGNLPVEMKRSWRVPSKVSLEQAAADTESSTSAEQLGTDELKAILDDIPCIGEISRQGKDAAGKRLENEFYYKPEMDADEMRKNAVVGSIGGTGLRAARRSHKQYYWKRPRA